MLMFLMTYWWLCGS